MKNIFCKILTFSLVFGILSAFCGCQSENKTENTKPSETHSATEAVKPTEQSSSGDEEFSLQSLHSYNPNSSDPFAGAWTITDGAGEQYADFIYLFDGTDKASLIMDNMGYMGKYSVENQLSEDGDMQSVFITQLMFGLNGTYTYTFSNDGNKVVLTSKDTHEDTTMEKNPDYNCIPAPEKSPEIDKDLLGAWKSSDGDYYYFDESGIMYENQYGATFTYFTYSAKDGKLTSTYKMDETVTDTQDYSISGKTLKLNGYEYSKIPVEELI